MEIMNIQLNSKRILIFITFVIVLSWVVVLAVKWSGMMDTNPTGGMMLANYIIITLPALANVFTRVVTKEGWKNLWLRLNIKHGWRFYLAAWLLPLLATGVGGGLYFLFFPQAFDPGLSQVRATFAPIPSLAAQPWLALLVLFVQTMFVVMLINGIASMGEEFGWRAYLLQKLMALFAAPNSDGAGVGTNPNTGTSRAALLVGLVWGVWHFPLFYLGSSLNFPFVLIYVVYTCSASVFLSWVTLRSGSVWPAAIGHGMLNATSAFPMLMSNASANPLLGPGPTSLIGMLGYVILAMALLFSTKAFNGKEEVQR
jgi:membrane protease YdiL (CAAX protease family)